MSNHFQLEYDGHVIEVEAQRHFSGKMDYSLIVDNERIDVTESTQGSCSLWGELNTDQENSKLFVVHIKTGILRDECFLDIDGKSLKLSRR